MHSILLKFAFIAAALTGFSAAASEEVNQGGGVFINQNNGGHGGNVNQVNAAGGGADLKKNEVKREGRRGSYSLHQGWNHEYCKSWEWEDFGKTHKLAFYNRDGSVFWVEYPYGFTDNYDVHQIYEACRSGKFGYDIYIDDPAGKLHWSKIRVLSQD